MSSIEIVHALESALVDAARRLFLDYQRELGVDLCFQDFDTELATLPGDYAPPRGRLFVAREGESLAGCVALRALDDATCEMKRLYVAPPFRKIGLGGRLAERVIVEARRIGYRRLVLDTLPSMESAQRLYERLGFREVEAYRYNPIAGARYLALELGERASR